MILPLALRYFINNKERLPVIRRHATVSYRPPVDRRSACFSLEIYIVQVGWRLITELFPIIIQGSFLYQFVKSNWININKTWTKVEECLGQGLLLLLLLAQVGRGLRLPSSSLYVSCRQTCRMSSIKTSTDSFFIEVSSIKSFKLFRRSAKFAAIALCFLAVSHFKILTRGTDKTRICKVQGVHF